MFKRDYESAPFSPCVLSWRKAGCLQDQITAKDKTQESDFPPTQNPLLLYSLPGAGNKTSESWLSALHTLTTDLHLFPALQSRSGNRLTWSKQAWRPCGKGKGFWETIRVGLWSLVLLFAVLHTSWLFCLSALSFLCQKGNTQKGFTLRSGIWKVCQGKMAMILVCFPLQSLICESVLCEWWRKSQIPDYILTSSGFFTSIYSSPMISYKYLHGEGQIPFLFLQRRRKSLEK